jgi:hypothetical protein
MGAQNSPPAPFAFRLLATAGPSSLPARPAAHETNRYLAPVNSLCDQQFDGMMAFWNAYDLLVDFNLR